MRILGEGGLAGLLVLETVPAVGLSTAHVAEVLGWPLPVLGRVTGRVFHFVLGDHEFIR